VSQTAGIYLLGPEHEDAIQRLASEPSIGLTSRVPHPYPEHGARDFIAGSTAARVNGEAYAFAVMDRGEVVGVCDLHDLLAHDRTPEIGYWIGREFQGKGYASFAVRMLLEFAFGNLRLAAVSAWAYDANAASRRVLEKAGFEASAASAPRDEAELRERGPLSGYALTRERWQALRDGPALARLHPSLRRILDAELAAGNEVVETGGGWPDDDSVFVRLRDAFRTRPSPIPDDVTYTEPNDPHWWRADYSSRVPRHVLAC
jgi:RimJ/RimL family protein N-acetyltransferase